MSLTRFQQTLCRLIAANRLEQGDLYRGSLVQLQRDLAADLLVFHPGSIRGAYPQISG
jgi:hypothetical protein